MYIGVELELRHKLDKVFLTNILKMLIENGYYYDFFTLDRAAKIIFRKDDVGVEAELIIYKSQVDVEVQLKGNDVEELYKMMKELAKLHEQYMAELKKELEKQAEKWEEP